MNFVKESQPSNVSENKEQKLNYSSKKDILTVPKTPTKNINDYTGKDLNRISSEKFNTKLKISKKQVFGVNGLNLNVDAAETH